MAAMRRATARAHDECCAQPLSGMYDAMPAPPSMRQNAPLAQTGDAAACLAVQAMGEEQHDAVVRPADTAGQHAATSGGDGASSGGRPSDTAEHNEAGDQPTARTPDGDETARSTRDNGARRRLSPPQADTPRAPQQARHAKEGRRTSKRAQPGGSLSDDGATWACGRTRKRHRPHRAGPGAADGMDCSNAGDRNGRNCDRGHKDGDGEILLLRVDDDTTQHETESEADAGAGDGTVPTAQPVVVVPECIHLDLGAAGPYVLRRVCVPGADAEDAQAGGEAHARRDMPQFVLADVVRAMGMEADMMCVAMRLDPRDVGWLAIATPHGQQLVAVVTPMGLLQSVLGAHGGAAPQQVERLREWIRRHLLDEILLVGGACARAEERPNAMAERQQRNQAVRHDTPSDGAVRFGYASQHDDGDENAQRGRVWRAACRDDDYAAPSQSPRAAQPTRGCACASAPCSSPSSRDGEPAAAAPCRARGIPDTPQAFGERQMRGTDDQRRCADEQQTLGCARRAASCATSCVCDVAPAAPSVPSPSAANQTCGAADRPRNGEQQEREEEEEQEAGCQYGTGGATPASHAARVHTEARVRCYHAAHTSVFASFSDLRKPTPSDGVLQSPAKGRGPTDTAAGAAVRADESKAAAAAMPTETASVAHRGHHSHPARRGRRNHQDSHGLREERLFRLVREQMREHHRTERRLCALLQQQMQCWLPQRATPAQCDGTESVLASTAPSIPTTDHPDND